MKAFCFVLFALSSACAPSKPRGLVLDSLYFGLNTPAGQVSEKEWADFVDGQVTPRFGQGFTVLDARGQWKDEKGGIVKEPTKVLQVAHPATPEADAALDALVKDYKSRFRQESVLRLRSAAEITY